jgi:multidrug resistance protein
MASSQSEDPKPDVELVSSACYHGSKDTQESGQSRREIVEEPYSLLSPFQKRCIGVLAGTAAMFSPLTANIYLPCVPLLVEDFRTSLQLINTTITAYLIVQGFSPTLFTQLAEKIGRRPVYLLSFSIFVASSVGLAAQSSYPALLVLRIMQSLGASVSTSLGYAVVSDIAAPSEKGKAFRPVGLLVNVGPVIAPVIGGPLCYQAGWRWIFWLLAIVGSSFLVCLVLLLPETHRKVVGNGSIKPRSVNKPILPLLVPRVKQAEEAKTVVYPSIWAKLKALAPNPLKSIKLVFQKDTFFVLVEAGLFYMMYYICQASLPPLFKTAYGFNETQIGLCYLPLSMGVILGSQIQSKFKLLSGRSICS